MTRVVPLVTRGFSALLMGVSAIALTACAELTATSELEAPVQPEAQTSKTKKKTNAPKTAAKVQDVPAPTAFAATDTAIWDGRPSLGAIWVAHPDAPQAERVQIVNKATGKKVAGALFTRKARTAGPPIQMSSQAALALGVGPGQTTELQITAIRPEDDIPVQMAAAPAKVEIWGDAEPAEAPETELLLAAQDAPVEEIGLAGAVPMGVFPDYDAALLVQARLSQAGVRSEIRETYLDEVIFYKVFAEQADSTIMVAEAEPPAPRGFEMASIERFVLPDQQTTVITNPLRDDAPVELSVSDAVIVAQLNLPSVAAPAESGLGVTLTQAQGGPLGGMPASVKAKEIAPLSVASVSEGPAMKPFLTFDAAVQYAGISLATPSLTEAGAILTPTHAPLDPPELATTTQLAKAEITFRPAPRALAKGTPTELVASISRPTAPPQSDRAHVRAAFGSHDPVARPAMPVSLAKALDAQDAPAGKLLERGDVTVMASLAPLGGQKFAASDMHAPKTTAQPKTGATPTALTTANSPTQLPTRPTQQKAVTLMAAIVGSVAPDALARAIEPSLMLKPRMLPATGIEVAMLGDGLPTVGATFAPIADASAAAGTRILARATPRPQRQVKKKPPEVIVIASILDLDMGSIRDATNIEMRAKQPGAGIAEIPNFNFGAAQSGADDANWFGLDLLGSKRKR